MDVPSDITVLDCSACFSRVNGSRESPGTHFSHTKAMLMDSDGNYFYARTEQRTSNTEDLILTDLKMHPIPSEHVFPEYHSHLLKAPDPIPSQYYIKHPSLHSYEYYEPKAEYKNIMMAEINICEFLRNSPHPNLAEYHGCVVGKDGLIRALCLTRYETMLWDLVMENPSSVNCESVLEGLRRGIEHLHSLDLVHNDINPANVMIHDGEPVIIDFDSCTKQGVERLKGGSIGWSKSGSSISDKQNDFYGLEKIREWLVKKCQKVEIDSE